MLVSMSENIKEFSLGQRGNSREGNFTLPWKNCPGNPGELPVQYFTVRSNSDFYSRFLMLHF